MNYNKLYIPLSSAFKFEHCFRARFEMPFWYFRHYDFRTKTSYVATYTLNLFDKNWEKVPKDSK